MLLQRQVIFGRTHDLNALIELLKQDGVQWPLDLEDAKDLTPYAVQMRYPGHATQLSGAEVEDAIQMADDVIAWVKSQITVP